MRKIIVTSIVILVFVLLWFQTPESGSQTHPAPTPTPTGAPRTSLPETHEDITWKETIYRVAWFSVTDPGRISLIPNYKEKLASQTVRDANDCTHMTSGGFYTEANTPLGLLTIGDKTIGKYKNSSLFNGIFSVSENGSASIGPDIPQEKTQFQLQSGPILLSEGSPKVLRLRSDELARRVFVAVSAQGDVLLGVVYDAEATFGGPLLADLPEILEAFRKKTNLSIVAALNLDGGSASTFSSEGIFLQELSSVGSFFCIK